MERKQRPLISLPLLLIILILNYAAWWLFVESGKPKLDPDAAPQPVVARGDLAADEKNSIEIFQSVSPSAVYITSVELRRDFFSLNVYEIPSGTGSGFVWDKEGRIVTNYHVIEDANTIVVTLNDNSTWKAALVGVAPEKDIAVLQIDAPAEALKPITVGDSGNLLVGQKVFAIGNPFGLDTTMTSGIVSALGREIESIKGRTIRGVIQTDAAINPGNSGGPLLDSAGLLIGVNTAIYSPSGASAGIGFAVPIEIVNRVVPQLIRYGKVIRPGLGITIAHDRIAQRLEVDGVLIINVHKGSSAEAAGLKPTVRNGRSIILGDIITGVNGKTIHTYDDLRNEFDLYEVGGNVSLRLLRGKDTVEFNVTLEQVE